MREIYVLHGEVFQAEDVRQRKSDAVKATWARKRTQKEGHRG